MLSLPALARAGSAASAISCEERMRSSSATHNITFSASREWSTRPARGFDPNIKGLAL
jgi:hypothetical protein